MLLWEAPIADGLSVATGWAPEMTGAQCDGRTSEALAQVPSGSNTWKGGVAAYSSYDLMGAMELTLSYTEDATRMSGGGRGGSVGPSSSTSPGAVK